MAKTERTFIENLLGSSGIAINGEQPWDLHVYNDKFYPRIVRDGALGLGEAYMEKWWDSPRLDIFFDRVLRAQLDTKINIPLSFYWKKTLATIVNFQSKLRAKDVALKHYNLSNTLFETMLDRHMLYSCGYWKTASTLDEAQTAKLELICQKLRLEPGLTLLDIGCGWGGLAKYAAEKYGVSVVGVTIAEEQYHYAKKVCAGLPIEIRLQDYRDINKKFDRIVSVGMFEHVGHPNYATFMRVTHHALKDDGLFLLHTIGVNDTQSFANEWITKYIFPNGMLPSMAQISKSAEKNFIVEDWHNFGAYYDNTLMAWYENFTQNWDTIKSDFDERFYRMWTYYLLSCAGAFRARSMQLWQLVLSKNGVSGVYCAPR
jgi:cyclopropane-fatty-acyl-phospholipid synthase